MHPPLKENVHSYCQRMISLELKPPTFCTKSWHPSLKQLVNDKLFHFLGTRWPTRTTGSTWTFRNMQQAKYHNVPIKHYTYLMSPWCTWTKRRTGYYRTDGSNRPYRTAGWPWQQWQGRSQGYKRRQRATWQPGENRIAQMHCAFYTVVRWIKMEEFNTTDWLWWKRVFTEVCVAKNNT